MKDLTMAYGDFVVQQDLNFAVAPGEIFIIMGGSGCGKTTLLRHMIGLQRPARGEVLYDGQTYWEADENSREAMQRRFGVLFQGGALLSSMTLGENVALPLGEFTRLTSAEIADVVAFKLSLVGLAGFEEFYPAELSSTTPRLSAIVIWMGPQAHHDVTMSACGRPSRWTEMWQRRCNGSDVSKGSASARQ